MTENYRQLAGKSVVITGATSGIGLAAAIRFTQDGAFVIGVGRSAARIDQATETIKAANPNSQVVFLLADLGDQDQVHELGDQIRAALNQYGYHHLDVLINNAGVYLEKKHITADGIEMTFAVNHLAQFILSHELFAFLQRSKSGRILTVTSYSHRITPLMLKRITNPYPYISFLAYKRSKLCNILFTYEFNHRFTSVEAFAVDPGLVNTRLVSKGDQGLFAWFGRRRILKGTSTDVPVTTLLFLSREDKIDTSNGYYFKGCQPQTPSSKARRRDLALDLWGLSSQLTGISCDE
ncbi:MAG: SDR family NAD(P)-dependent oxidoreductase [Brevefilum sp.]|nr:SDR family NAD(P)-dependent oxidoreductase [Brevefilum sp.]